MSEKRQKRLDRLERALEGLKESLETNAGRISRNSSILCFILAYELAWKSLKWELERSGKEIKSPREALREAFQEKLIGTESEWMETLEYRNDATHAYDESLEAVHKLFVGSQKLAFGLRLSGSSVTMRLGIATALAEVPRGSGRPPRASPRLKIQFFLLDD